MRIEITFISNEKVIKILIKDNFYETGDNCLLLKLDIIDN